MLGWGDWGVQCSERFLPRQRSHQPSHRPAALLATPQLRNRAATPAAISRAAVADPPALAQAPQPQAQPPSSSPPQAQPSPAQPCAPASQP